MLWQFGIKKYKTLDGKNASQNVPEGGIKKITAVSLRKLLYSAGVSSPVLAMVLEQIQNHWNSEHSPAKWMGAFPPLSSSIFIQKNEKSSPESLLFRIKNEMFELRFLTCSRGKITIFFCFYCIPSFSWVPFIKSQDMPREKGWISGLWSLVA